MEHRRKKKLIIVCTALLLTALACSLPGGIELPFGAGDGQEEAGEVTPEDTSIPPTAPSEPTTEPTEPTAEPSEPTTAPSECTLDSDWVADVTVPDGKAFPPSAPFTKVWRVRNSGTCRWEPGTELVYISGDQMDAPDSVPVGALAPGSNTDISVNMVAPSTPGTYKGNWQLEAPDGTRFGAVFYVEIEVPEPHADTPTPSDTPSICVTPAPVLEPILQHANDLGHDIGCPTAEALTVNGAFQEFWANVNAANPHLHYRSLMIWRGDKREIYIIDGEDTDASEGNLLAYTDFWEEGDPEVHPDCAAMTPPSGYQLPVRGFGKVWCENELWDVVGWPSEHEVGVEILMQPTQTGLLMKVSGPMPTAYLVALDYQAVRGVTQMMTP